MKLEETLNGSYLALQGEIVDKDIYHMKDVKDIVSINDPNFVHEKGHKRPFDFEPEIIIDLGCNIGLFSRYARSLFPKAYIVSVEPDRENCKKFIELTEPETNLILINKAIGSGQVWKSNTSKNGAGENYITVGVAYPEKELEEQSGIYELSEVRTITLSELINLYVEEGQKFIIKIDIEGNEQVIFGNEKEMAALKKADYITGELHYFAVDGKTNIAIRQKINEALVELQLTHDVEMNHLNFYAVKK